MPSLQYANADPRQVQRYKDLANSMFDPNAAFGYGERLQGYGQNALQGYMNTVGQSLGQQFTPQFAAARAGLAANPLLADSGFANRLNRRLQTDAMRAYSGAGTDAARQMAFRNQDILAQLLQQRLGQRGQFLGQLFTPYQQPGAADYLAQLGAAIPAAAASGFGG